WSLPNNRGDHTNSEANEVKSVAVIGSGTMGKAMAICFCLAGFETFLVVRSEQKCSKELEMLFAQEKELKRLNDARIEKIKNKLQITTDLQNLKDADLVIESVFEDLKLKRDLFAKLDGICKVSCIFGTNTSSLDLEDIACVLRDPSRLVGLHFFNPANIIRLVEKEHGLEPNPLEKEMWKQNRYGRKTNKGFYKYNKETQRKEIDDEMEQMIRRCSQTAHPNIKIQSDQDVINFILYPTVNEGFLCIEEGIISHESLIDIMYILGFGWPPHTGGPMRFGKTEGLQKIASTLLHWHSLQPEDKHYKVANELQQADKKKYVVQVVN
ncbi:hypothetical protein CAEBREN_31287, partial [Caenorhabditis brenneri]